MSSIETSGRDHKSEAGKKFQYQLVKKENVLLKNKREISHNKCAVTENIARAMVS